MTDDNLRKHHMHAIGAPCLALVVHQLLVRTMQSHSDSVIAPPRFPLFNHSADNFLLSLKPTVVVVAHDVDEVEVFVHLRHVVGSERGC